MRWEALVDNTVTPNECNRLERFLLYHAPLLTPESGRVNFREDPRKT